MINGRIVGRKTNGDIIIRPDADCLQDIELMRKKRQTFLTMESMDDKKITRAQQKKIYALIRDINSYERNEHEYVAKIRAKLKFMQYLDLPFKTIESLFSLSNCDKELASEFITYLVEYCFEHDIPFDRKDLHTTYDIGRLMFLSSVHNRCFATQRMRHEAVLHIHHINAIGKEKRLTADHRKRWYMILTAELHNEIHWLGYRQFCAKYHCSGLQLTDEQLIEMKLMTRKQMQERDADPEYEIRDWQLPELKVA